MWYTQGGRIITQMSAALLSLLTPSVSLIIFFFSLCLIQSGLVFSTLALLARELEFVGHAEEEGGSTTVLMRNQLENNWISPNLTMEDTPRVRCLLSSLLTPDQPQTPLLLPRGHLRYGIKQFWILPPPPPHRQ